MTYENVEQILGQRALLRPAINEEMIEFTGKSLDFIWTDKVLFKGYRLWHEFKVIGENLIMYAALGPTGAIVVNEVEEIHA
jgi:hypothetical protein